MDVETWHQPVLLSSWGGSDNGLSTVSRYLVLPGTASRADTWKGRAEQYVLPAEATDESEEALKIGAEGS